MTKQQISVISAVAALGGTYLSILYINPYNNSILLSELVLQLSGSRGIIPLGVSLPELLDFALLLGPECVFSAFVGTYLYQDFCIASVYVFSRYPNRVRWYYSEIAIILFYTILFEVIKTGVTIIITIVRFNVAFDNAGYLLLIIHLLIYIMWWYSIAIIINVLAVYSGSSFSYMAATGSQMFCIVLLSLLGKEGQTKYLIFDPIAHIVIGWHGSTNNILSAVPLCARSGNLTLAGSLITLVTVSALISAVGGFLMACHDLTVTNMETGGF